MSGREAGKLEKPWIRHAIIVALAQGEKTQRQIAGEYGADESSITTFKQRHLAEIEAMRQNNMDQLTGIAIANKQTRLAVYQELLDAVTRPTPKTAGKDGDYVRDPETKKPIMEIDAGVAAKILRNIAEELGHLPSRVMISGELEVKTNYTLNGVDVENLK